MIDTHIIKFITALGDDIDKFIYRGGSKGSRLVYWNQIKQIEKNEINPYESIGPDDLALCVCGHKIIEKCYVQNIITKEYKLIGNCCVKKFIGKKRFCSHCKKEHKNIKSNLCSVCRLEYCKYCHIQCNKTVCDKCIVQYTSKNRCKQCNCLFNDRKNYYFCKDHRLKCYICNTYHSNNLIHTHFCKGCKTATSGDCQDCINNKIITAGKYAGYHYDDISDISYKNYFRDLVPDRTKSAFKHYHIYLNTCNIHNKLYCKCNKVIPYGKHKGKQYKDINDVNWVKFIFKKYKENTLSDSLIDFLDYFMEKNKKK